MPATAAASAATVLTIHNIGYQGSFPEAQLDTIGLGDQRAHVHHGDLREGRFSCLKTGVLHSSKITTVSRTYAKEIQTAELGMGMDEATLDRAALGRAVVHYTHRCLEVAERTIARLGESFKITHVRYSETVKSPKDICKRVYDMVRWYIVAELSLNLSFFVKLSCCLHPS